MGILDRETLKKLFSDGKLPIGQDFANWIDSYFHKNDQIEESSVYGLEDDLKRLTDDTDRLTKETDHLTAETNRLTNEVFEADENIVKIGQKLKQSDDRFSIANELISEMVINKESVKDAEAKYKDLDGRKVNQDDLKNYLKIDPKGLQDGDIAIHEGNEWIRKPSSELSTIKTLTLQENGETVGTFDGSKDTAINIANEIRLLPTGGGGIGYINIDTQKKEIDFGSDPILLINNKMYDLLANQKDVTKYRNVSIVVEPSNAIKIYFDKINFLFFATAYDDNKIYPNTVLVGAIRFVAGRIMADLPSQYTVDGVLASYAPIVAQNIIYADINRLVDVGQEIDINTFIDRYGNKTSGSSLFKGDFIYANNDILKTDYGSINLASVTGLISGISAQYKGAQTLLMCGSNSPTESGLKNELLMYDGRPEGYFSGWTRMLNDHNFNTFAPKLDGTNATGTWSINVKGDVTANHITASDITQLSKIGFSDPNSYIIQNNSSIGFYTKNGTFSFQTTDKTSDGHITCGRVDAGGGFFETSDATLKNNVRDIDVSYGKDIHFVEFDRTDTKHHGYGVIAQEVEQLYPTVVATDEKSGIKQVNYNEVYAIKLAYLDEENRRLNDRMKMMEEQIVKLQKLLAHGK